MKEREIECTEHKETNHKVELMVQLKMIEIGVSKKEAYVWCYDDLTQKPPPNNKPGWYVTKSDSELTVEEKESIKICKSMWIKEVEKEQERAKSGKEDEKESEVKEFDGRNGEEEHSYIVFRRDLGCAIWVLRNKTEYNRLCDLSDTTTYHSKLLSQYGFNGKTGGWNLKLFPVTRTDAQMGGIKFDFDTYVKALTNLNEYNQYLARKYNIDLGESQQYNEWIFYYQPTPPGNVFRRMKITFSGNVLKDCAP